MTNKLIKYGIIVTVALILVFTSTYYIKPGYCGTLVTLGSVSQSSYSNGIGFKPPFISRM